MILFADSLTIVRGSRALLSGLSFSARSGEPLVITGPNGAGKTTLIRTLAGFLTPETGRIALEGGDAERDTAEQCHYVGHLTGIKSSLTVAGNLAFWARYLEEAADAGISATERVRTALDQFALTSLADIPAGLLSAGQKRRLGLARLLVAKRPVWLLDEPTVSLDVASTELLAALITEHLDGGGIAIAATHLPLGLKAPAFLKLGASEAAC